MLAPKLSPGFVRVALATTALLAGCARPPAPRDTVRIAVSSPPESLDPRFTTSAVAVRLAALIASPLVTIGDDLRPHPCVAEALDHPDPLTWLVKVRQGLRFPDGTAVTARDVRYSLLSIKDPALASPHAAKLAHVKDVVVVDERTAKIELDAPYPPLPVDMNAYGILEERTCSSRPRCVDGVGPFHVVHDLDRDERIELAANDSSPFGAIAIRNVQVRVVRDTTTRAFLLEDGRVDLVDGDWLPTDLGALSRRHDLVVDDVPGIGFSYLALNVRGPRDGDSADAQLTHRALADPRVRRALAMAIDVDTIIATKLQGRARRATGILPAAHWAKLEDEPAIAYDPAAARALLRDAGFPKFHIALATTTDRLRKATALIFAEEWRAVGLDVDVEVRDWSALYEDIQKGAFDAFSAKWTPVIEPDLMHWVYASSSIPAPGHAGGNRSGYVDKDADRWLDEARTTDDESARIELYALAQERVARDLPLVPLWFEDETAVHSARLLSFKLDATASLLPIARAHLLEPSQ